MQPSLGHTHTTFQSDRMAASLLRGAAAAAAAAAAAVTLPHRRRARQRCYSVCAERRDLADARKESHMDDMRDWPV